MVQSTGQLPRSRFGRVLRNTGIHLASTLFLLAVLEGLAAFLMRGVPEEPQRPPVRRHVAERQHTRYDELLGWVNEPNTTVSNMYGEGLHVTINNMGFRGEAATTEPPPGHRRILVSGDSFTFGYGVTDEHSWSHQLEHKLENTEILNLGLGGYGLGQAYLLYQREGDPLPHDLHIFAFITENFRRMTRSTFMGYGKPVVTVRDGQLAVENVPPPWPQKKRSLLPASWLGTLQRLNLMRLLNHRLARLHEARADHWSHNAEETARLIFEDVHRMHQQAGRQGLLVYLPVKRDHWDDDSDHWRAWLADLAGRQGWRYLDLIPAFRALPRESIHALFIPEDQIGYSGAKGHYTESGNRWVADQVHRYLLEQPELAPLFTEPPVAPDSKAL